MPCRNAEEEAAAPLPTEAAMLKDRAEFHD